jgi:hypothetical protein
VNVFGGGLALYNATKQAIGAIGVSGDSSCADHNIAWKLRQQLVGLGSNAVGTAVPSGVDGNGADNIVYDISSGVSAAGWGHAQCGTATSPNPLSSIAGSI